MADLEPKARSHSSSRIAGLDGLRAVAVTFVFLSHRTSLLHDSAFGSIGVHLFFVLSGFLIIGILHRRRQEIEAGRGRFPVEWLAFLRNRSFRIFPIYYVLVFSLFLLTLLTGAMIASPAVMVAALTYTVNVIMMAGQTMPLPYMHLWSLSIEEQFYLLSAPLFLSLPSRLLRPACVGIIAIGMFSYLLYAFGFYHRAIFVAGEPANFALMAVGGLLATAPAFTARSSLIGWLAALAFLAIPAVIRFLSLGHEYLNDFLDWVLAPAAVCVLISSIIQNQQGALVRMLHLWPVRSLGRISYGFYLFHDVFDLRRANVSGGEAFAGNFMISVIVAALSWKFFEEPILRFREKVFSRAPEGGGPDSMYQPLVSQDRQVEAT